MPTLKLDPEPHCNFPAPHLRLTVSPGDVSSSYTASAADHHHVNSMPAFDQTMEYQTSFDVT